MRLGKSLRALVWLDRFDDVCRPGGVGVGMFFGDDGGLMSVNGYAALGSYGGGELGGSPPPRLDQMY